MVLARKLQDELRAVVDASWVSESRENEDEDQRVRGAGMLVWVSLQELDSLTAVSTPGRKLICGVGAEKGRGENV